MFKSDLRTAHPAVFYDRRSRFDISLLLVAVCMQNQYSDQT